MKNGFSLIEVLISLLILSLILLGFDAMEIDALRENRNAYYFSVAENQLNSIAQRIQAHPQDITKQLMIWNQQNQQILPQGKGNVSGLFPNYIVTIFWGEKHVLSMEEHL